jgi:transposase
MCGTESSGRVVFEELIETRAAALHSLLKGQKRRIQLIGLESGMFGIVLSRSLRKLGYPVAMFDARQASKFLAIRRNKTDKNDARGLADVARLGRECVSEVRVKTPECQRLRSTLVTRQKLVRLRVMAEGTMRSLFRLNGGKLNSSYSADALRKNVNKEIRRMRKVAKVDLSEDIEPLLELSAATRRFVEGLDQRLAKRAEEDPVCRRFLEIPGVGPITALAFKSSIEDPHRFTKNANVGAYLGLVPRVRQSGQSTARLRISKMGDSMTRAYLTSAAQHHVRDGKSAVAAWSASLSERLHRRGVYVAVARKLAIMMLAMWKSGERYDPHHVGSCGAWKAELI